MNLNERFWSKVNIQEKDDCWNWTGAIDTPGYGAFKLNGKKIDSNRMAWILTFGEIKNDLWVLHKCIGNRLCCNPNHLYLGTRSDNMKDCARENRLPIVWAKKVFGEEHGNAKLSNETVSNIKRDLLNGIRNKDVCLKYRLDKRLVSQIKLEKSWKKILPAIN